MVNDPGHLLFGGSPHPFSQVDIDDLDLFPSNLPDLTKQDRPSGNISSRVFDLIKADQQQRKIRRLENKVSELQVDKEFDYIRIQGLCKQVQEANEQANLAKQKLKRLSVRYAFLLGIVFTLMFFTP